MALPDFMLPLGYNYRPGSYTPVQCFDPPTHWNISNLLYKAEKPSVCLSVHLHRGIISVVSVWIDLGLGLCIAEVFET